MRTWPAPSPDSSWSITAVPVARTGTATRPERLFAEDEPGAPDFAAALKWSRQPAEAGSAKAQAVVAYCRGSGSAIEKNLQLGHFRLDVPATPRIAVHNACGRIAQHWAAIQMPTAWVLMQPR